MSSHSFIVESEYSGKRLDNYLSALLASFSRGAIQKAIKAGNCRIDGETAAAPSVRVRCGQHIRLEIPELSSELIPINLDVKILWHDENLLVCDKPAGIAVHPAPSMNETSYIQALLHHFPQIGLQGGLRPGIVHRLDKDTSGALLAALNESARLALSESFANRKIDKTYLAIVKGAPPERGICREPLGRDENVKTRMAVVPEKKGGRSAHTEWKRLWNFENEFSLLEVKIYTGRTHQIRTHLAHLGFPILGDKVYGDKISKAMAPRQMLHAWKIGFVHPCTQKFMSFTAPPPDDFLAVLTSFQKKFIKLIVTGNAGSGKSTFCNVLAKKNISCISADEIVSRLYQRGGAAWRWLKKRFGAEILLSDGNVDKNALFALMSEDERARDEVEEMVQSAVNQEIERFFESRKKDGETLAAAEIPLFFECGGLSERNDCIVVGIDCPSEIRHARLQEKRAWTPEKIATIEKWQMPNDEKMALCDYKLANDRDEKTFARDAEELLATIRKDIASSSAKLKGMFCGILDDSKPCAHEKPEDAHS